MDNYDIEHGWLSDRAEAEFKPNGFVDRHATFKNFGNGNYNLGYRKALKEYAKDLKTDRMYDRLESFDRDGELIPFLDKMNNEKNCIREGKCQEGFIPSVFVEMYNMMQSDDKQKMK